MRIGTNVIRRLTSGPGSTTAGQRAAIASQAEAPTLQRAVVIDVIVDLSLLTEDYLSQVANIVDNPELADVMPVGSIIAKIVSNHGGTSANNNTILFPFFSSHIMLPVQPGEQVYVIYEDYTVNGAKLGYWFTRTHGFGTFEDANYTHHDRRFDGSINPGNYTTGDLGNRPTTLVTASFPNGGSTTNTLTLAPSGNLGESPYETIWTNALAKAYVTPEPVPRWKKRPQEFVLQGSNNSLIVLGEDRNGPISGSVQASPVDITRRSPGVPRLAGSVDIVVGRGRYLPSPGENPRIPSSTNPPGDKSTAPLVVPNSRGYLETDKNPFKTQREGIANPREGDPDPIHDAARLYVVMQSKVDENYKLAPGTGGLEYPPECIANEQPAGAGAVGRSYVVAKADNIRLVARREPQTGGTENIAGSILIVREGNKNTTERGGIPSSAANPNDSAAPNGNLAYVLLDKQGQIQIEAKKIVLGRGNDEKEPYIRWTYYNVQIEELKTQLKALADQVQDITNKYNEAMLRSITVPYSPVASLVDVGPRVLTETMAKVATIKTQIDTINQEDAKSRKIFGE